MIITTLLIIFGVIVLLSLTASIAFQIQQFKMYEDEYKTAYRFIKDTGLMTIGLIIIFTPAIIGGVLSWYNNRKMYKRAEADLKVFMCRDLTTTGEWALAPERQRLGISHGFIFYSIERRLKTFRWTIG